MAIVKKGLRVSRNSNQSQTPSSSSTDDELQLKENRPYEACSGGESDTTDDSDIAEVGAELCMVGDQKCSVPYELFDLPDLKQILSLDAWNSCLTEEERYNLSAYLPDMDQQTFRLTLKELLAGEELNFCSPLTELFNRLKGGLCPPKVSRYREGLLYLQRKEHYHLLRNYHNNMVNNFTEMQNAWKNCSPGTGFEEKIQIWNVKKNRNLPQVESQALVTCSRQASEPLKKGKPGRPPGHSSKKAKTAKNQGVADPVYVIPQEKSLTTTNGKGVLKVMAPTKGPSESSTGRLEAKETTKIEKRTPRGVLKIVPKGLIKRHEQPQMKQLKQAFPPFSEIQAYETQVRPPFPQAMGGWEADGYIGETSFSQPKSRDRKQKKCSEIPESVARQQGVELSNFNAGSGKMDSGYDKKRVHDQSVLNNIGGQVPVWLGRDTRHFDEDDNLGGGKRFMPDHRRYVQEGAMFNEDGSYAEQQWRQTDKQIREHHRNSVEQYKLPVEQYHNIGEYQTTDFHQRQSSFEQQMYPNSRKLDFKGPGKVRGEQNNLQKKSERSKKKHREIMQSSEEPWRISDERRAFAEEHGERTDDSLEDQSDFVETRRHLVDSSGLLDNSKRMFQDQKRRKQSQIDDISIPDSGKKQEELMVLEGLQNGIEAPKKYKKKKDHEKTEAVEYFSPQVIRSEYDSKPLDGSDKPKSVKIKIKKPKESAKIPDRLRESNGLQDGAQSS